MTKTINPQITNAISLAILVLGMIGVAGCGPEPTGPFRSSGLPSKEYLVGGGFIITWLAPEDGTAYVVEETTTKILQTGFLQKGEKIDFHMGLEPDEFERIMGIKLGEATFNLYFVPATKIAQ